MKSVLIILTLVMALPCLALEPVDHMRDRLPYGTYRGMFKGQSCIVDVSTDPIPSSTSASGYTVFVINNNGYEGHYGLWTGPPMGGRGDCPMVERNDGRVLRVQNMGSNPPCNSNLKRSNQQGLLIEGNSVDNTAVISTLTSSGRIEASCQVNLP